MFSNDLVNYIRSIKNDETLEYKKRHDNDYIKFLLSLEIHNTQIQKSYTATWAVKTNNLEILKFIVSKDFDISCNNNYLLQMASKYGYLAIVMYLVSLGADIHSNYDYPIEMACIYGHLDIMKYFLKKIKIKYISNSVLNMPLEAAIKKGHLNIVKYMVNNGGYIENYNIKQACQYNHIDIAKCLIDKRKQVSPMKSIINYIPMKYRYIIFGEKIWSFYKRQKMRKQIINIRNQLIPIYYHPEMKGGYFEKKKLREFLDEI